jgi:hypothetical protein
MAGAKTIEIGVVEARRFDGVGARLHGIAHAEL